jgi:hypothetical protein
MEPVLIIKLNFYRNIRHRSDLRVMLKEDSILERMGITLPAKVMRRADRSRQATRSKQAL